MAQHDYVIDNQASAAARADLNNLFQAIASQNSGATAPATTYANMIWYETDTNTLWKRNEANSGWISMGVFDEAALIFTPSGGPVIATQAEAEAGADNTKMMTPLRVAQAIDAQVPAPPDSMTLLGTLTTTSGSTQTLSGLDLTTYKDVLFYVRGVSCSAARALRIDSRVITNVLDNDGEFFRGFARFSLEDGTGFAAIASVNTSGNTSDPSIPYGFKISYTNASTSIVFSWDSTGNFDAGSIIVYGVK